MADDELIESAFEALTYPTINLTDHTLDEQNLSRACPLDNGHHAHEKQGSLGSLECLPLELLCDVLYHLDSSTLAIFRRLNTRAVPVLDALHSYKTLVHECPDIVRAIYSIGYGSHITLDYLGNALCTVRCQGYGDFGGYLYLLSCQRVCYRCFWRKLNYFPLQPAEAARQYGVNRRSLEDLPTMQSVPGSCTSSEKSRLTRMILVDREIALQRAIEVHGSADAMWAVVKRNTSALEGTYGARLTLRRACEQGSLPQRSPQMALQAIPYATWL
jgi:hypothetical protein